MRKTNFSIIYFLLIFFVVYYGFYLYVGFSTPGGKIYFAFLHDHLDMPYWLSAVVAKCAEVVLKMLGYNAYQKSAINVSLRGGHGVQIIWGCVGIGVMIVWLAFVLAHKAGALYKLRWLLAGIGLIFLFNIMRIVAIVLSINYHWAYLESFNAHSTFNNITYLIIAGMMVFFVYRYNKMGKRKERKLILTSKH